MKNIFSIVSAGIVVGLGVLFGAIQIVYAETVVTDGYLQNDTVWDRQHSPYILDDVLTVPQGTILTIGPGVEIYPDPTSEYQPYIYVAGSLNMSGSEADPVSVKDIWGITINHGSAQISNASLSMLGELAFVNAQGVISTSTVSNTTDGIYSNDSSVSIKGSRIEHNVNGIFVKDANPVFQVNNKYPVPNTGGIGNALDGLTDIGVTITDSSIENNLENAIKNTSTIPVQAKGNWWGRVEGPVVDSANINGMNAANSFGDGSPIIAGPVEYDPWLDHDPTRPTVATCCSSIIFLPGLEASRLYRPESGIIGMSTTTNRLWEPNRNEDVRKLFLDSNGSSTDTSIYVGGPIDKAFGLVGVYGPFMDFLDDLSKKGTIGEWKAFGYDWRKPIAEVVAGRERRATTSESLIETVYSLASHSKTGKVTLIAHSNGGLVAKYLVKTLADMGKENLIDSVISVAVPYFGTPQTVLDLLHGDSQSIAGGLILKKSVAKELGTNMASAYSLLPSAAYFSKIFSPTIAYAYTGATATPVTSLVAQDSFIGSRTNSLLMNAGEILHGILDPFTWPATIARWAIVGLGNRTAKGIVYSNSNNTKYSATTTSMGDGTVVAPSATYNSGTVAAIDLKSETKEEHKNVNHMNIISASTTKAIIGNIISTNSADGNTKVTEAISKLPGVTIGEPDYSKEATFLVVSTHSPVNLDVYDHEGNHTGLAPLPAGLDEDIEAGLFKNVEENILGSSFETYGDEDQPETYISLPDDSGQTYSVNIQGIGVGEFTYKIERIRGEEVLDSVTYASLPVTPLMSASSTVSSQKPDTDFPGGTNTAPVRLASSTPALKIDIDGNGSVDISAKMNVEPDPSIFLEALKKMVAQLIGSNNRSNVITKRIDRLEDLVKKGKFKKMRDNSQKLKKIITHKKSKTLSDTEKTQIIDMIDVFIAQFEQI